MADAGRQIGALSVAGLLFLLLCLAPVRAEEPDKASCSDTVNSWADAQLLALSTLPSNSSANPFKLRDLLFFLHVPRTGGRTFHQCFLKHLFASDQRCPVSYDKLRIDRSQPGCRLISTHDDYSLLEKLSSEITSVVTTLRKPVDRVLSAYEFSIEVAARSLKQQKKRPLASKVSKFMSTLDIWPWKYLVPTMLEDLLFRRDARLDASSVLGLDLGVEKNVSLLSANNSYDAAALAMPFHEFIHHPVAHELVHNGATFQVAGLTNTSYSQDAALTRSCVVRFPHLGMRILEVAKKRLDRMLYVGLTDRQDDSAVFFTKVVGGQVSMEMFLRSMIGQKRYRSTGSSHGVPRVPKLPQNFTSIDDFKEEDVIEELLASYRECVVDLRKVQENRRSMSLGAISPIKFSRERRRLIPDSVMEEVGLMNGLDGELYAHAEKIFAQQQAFLRRDAALLVNETVSEPEPLMGDGFSKDSSDTEEQGYLWEILWEILPATGNVIFPIISVTPFAMALIYVVRKRRAARAKETGELISKVL